MSLKDKWASKTDLNTKTFEFLGEQVQIRELSGMEKVAAQQIEDPIQQQFYIWERCVISESIKLTKGEFRHAFDTSHSEIDYIITQILQFSCLDLKSREELEGN